MCIAITLLWLTGSKVSAEVIRQFNADIRLNSDCSLDVIEIIQMDFENSQRHGIFRIIPVTYSRYGGSYNLIFHTLDLTDENNKALNYEESHMGSDVNIKIGNSDQLLSGKHTYIIHYLVRRAVNFFSDAPEVYWNCTGNDWPFDIERADIRFYPPPTVGINDVKSACYVGPLGSTVPGNIRTSNSYIDFEASKLKAGSGITIVARLPVGSVAKPPFWQEALWFFIDWWGLIIVPVLTLVWILPILSARINDPEGHKAIAVEWNPPKDLSPAEVGTLVDENCDTQDIVSTLVDLAVRGYLQIKEIEAPTFLFFSNKDYEFVRVSSNKGDDILLPHERQFLNALFGGDKPSVKLSDLKEKFYVNLPMIRQSIYQSLTNKKLFVENPDSVRTTYRVWAFLIFVVAIFVMAMKIIPSHVSIGVGLIVSAGIVLIAAQFMPARTKEGWKARAQCLGFQRFVRLAEKDRIAVLAKDDPTIFGRLLPFAMVLGAADQWAEAFHGLLLQPPSWYVPYGYGNPDYSFSSRNFVHDLGQGMNTMGQTFTSVPSASAGSGSSGFSGGLSGGGFGGGGGGSW